MEHARPHSSNPHPTKALPLQQNESAGHLSRRSSIGLVHAVASQHWSDTCASSAAVGLAHSMPPSSSSSSSPSSCSAALASDLMIDSAAHNDSLPQVGAFDKTAPSYDRSLFDDNDNDQDILQLAGSEWMKEFESASEKPVVTPSFSLQASVNQLGQDGQEALTLAPQSSLALTLNRPHSVGSQQPLRRHMSRFGFNDNESAGFPFSSHHPASVSVSVSGPGMQQPMDYYDDEGSEHLVVAHGAEEYFYPDYPESELAYDAYYLGGGPSALEEPMVVGSTTALSPAVVTAAAKGNPAMYHAAGAAMQVTSTGMSGLPLSYSSIIKSHNVGLNPIPAGVLSLPMDNAAEAAELSEVSATIVLLSSLGPHASSCCACRMIVVCLCKDGKLSLWYKVSLCAWRHVSLLSALCASSKQP